MISVVHDVRNLICMSKDNLACYSGNFYDWRENKIQDVMASTRSSVKAYPVTNAPLPSFRLLFGIHVYYLGYEI
jgi:hypothetical protein